MVLSRSLLLNYTPKQSRRFCKTNTANIFIDTIIEDFAKVICIVILITVATMILRLKSGGSYVTTFELLIPSYIVKHAMVHTFSSYGRDDMS